MHIPALLTSFMAISAAGLSIWPFGGDRTPPDIPQMVRLDPEPFEHRLDGDWQRDGWPVDAPLAVVSIPAPVEIMATAVSNAQWQACMRDNVCAMPLSEITQPDLPVTGVNLYDANAYAEWLSRKTGDKWRLPSNLEWAHAAAEMFRDDSLGTDSDPNNPAVLWLAEYAAESARQRELDREIRPVGSLNVNSRGIHDIGGAVWEWTSTCLRRVETDQSGAIRSENETCGIYIVEGLHRAAIVDFVRDPKSGGCSVGVPPSNLGFRLVREID